MNSLFLTIILCVAIFINCAPVKSAQGSSPQQPMMEINATKSVSFTLVVKKSERKMYLYNEQAKLVKTYKIALGFTPTEQK